MRLLVHHDAASPAPVHLSWRWSSSWRLGFISGFWCTIPTLSINSCASLLATCFCRYLLLVDRLMQISTAIVGCSVQAYQHVHSGCWPRAWARCDRTVHPGWSRSRESQGGCRRTLTSLRGCGGGWIQIYSSQSKLWAVALLRCRPERIKDIFLRP